MEVWLIAFALLVGVAGAVTDLASRRIPNVLTYTAIAAAVGLRCALQGWSGLLSALLGGLIGGAAFLLFFLLRAMGAGDVKLMAAVGCFAGPHKIVEIILATAICGGILAIAFAAGHRRLRSLFSNLADLLRFHAAVGAVPHPTLNLSNPAAVRMPYALAIVAGVLYSFVVTIA